MGKKKVKVKSNKNSPLEEVRKKKPLLGRGWGGSSPSLGGVEEASPSKILVIQQKMIGDVLVSSLICENLKLNYPEAKVHYVVNRFTIPVIEKNPYIDEIVVFEEEYRSNKFAFYKFLNHIRQSNYDVVIDAYGKLESNLITLCSGAKIKIGWEKSLTKLLYTSKVKISNTSKIGLGSAIENRLNLVKALKNSEILSHQPKIHLTQNEIETAKEKIKNIKAKETESILMISALGSNKCKTYPVDYMAEILDFIVENTNALLILNYMPSQNKSIEKLYSLCKKNTQKNILVDFEIESLREFMSILKFCKAIIGNEGGAINMAKALDIPTFSIFSPQIIKEGWNGFEDHTLKHISVHLKDYMPNALHNDEIGLAELYKLFEFSNFKTTLKKFLSKHVD